MAQMPVKHVKELGLKMLRWIEQIHSLGYVHCDIKPENFVYSASENSDDKDLILIDFGMVHKYVDPNKNNRHIPYERAEDFKGTPSFSSLSALRGYKQSRRDDIESLAYVLMYAASGELPWQKYRAIIDYEEKVEKIIESKANVFYYDFIKLIPSCLKDLLKYCRSLQFREKPNYEYIAALFNDQEASRGLGASSVKVVLQSPQINEAKHEEVKIQINQNTNGERSFVPNSSFTDTKQIKSFSFLKEGSNHQWAVSKFKVYSDKSESMGEGEDELDSESYESSVSEWSLSASNVVYPLPTYKQPTPESIDIATGNKSAWSGAHGIKSTDASPGCKTFMMQKAGQTDVKVWNQDDPGKGKTTSQKSLFIFHQSSNLVNLAVESEENCKYNFTKRPFMEVYDDIPEENATQSENFPTSELGECEPNDDLLKPTDYIFTTNQQWSMFKSGNRG